MTDETRALPGPRARPSGRASAHKDPGVLTLLLIEPGRVACRSSTHGGWIDAPPVEDAFVVNIGEAMEYATDGYPQGHDASSSVPAAGHRTTVGTVLLQPALIGDAADRIAHRSGSRCARRHRRPHNPISGTFGENMIKAGLRAHPDVAARHHPTWPEVVTITRFRTRCPDVAYFLANRVRTANATRGRDDGESDWDPDPGAYGLTNGGSDSNGMERSHSDSMPSAVVNSVWSPAMASRMRRSYASEDLVGTIGLLSGELHRQLLQPHPRSGPLTVERQRHPRLVGQVERRVIGTLAPHTRTAGNIDFGASLEGDRNNALSSAIRLPVRR